MSNLFQVQELPLVVNGLPIIRLERDATDLERPSLVQVDIAPGRGFHIMQMRAYIPGQGLQDLLMTPPLDALVAEWSHPKAHPEYKDDPFGNESFKYGGAILVPWANRIRGDLVSSHQLKVSILGKTVHLPANWQGQKAGAERHALHGLILNQPVHIVSKEASDEGASLIGELEAGDFRGQWVSETRLFFEGHLSANGFLLKVRAMNTGRETLPIGIGWHPYFRILSGERKQARLHIPAGARLEVNNYDDVFPTGHVIKVHGSEFDVAQPDGLELGSLFLDDCFVNLNPAEHKASSTQNSGHELEAWLVDPAANLKIRINPVTPAIHAYQVYAPPTSSFVAIEPQFNWSDPFSSIWGEDKPKGMSLLAPDTSVDYAVRVQTELWKS